MARKLPLLHFLLLGVDLGLLQERQRYQANMVAHILDEISAALAYFPELAAEKARVDFQAKKVTQEVEKDLNLSEARWDMIGRLVAIVYDALEEKLSSQQAILVDHHEVLTKLEALRPSIRHPEMLLMLEETIRCFEAGAYRAATVCCWMLTYEHFRRWIFVSKRKRLLQFNSVLITKKRNGSSFYAPISHYEDFHDISERNVIDWAHEAKLIRKHPWQVLVNALTDRNHFAHPNSRGTSITSTSGYVENLIISILTSPTFAFRRSRKKSS